jgi:hypothetical protein
MFQVKVPIELPFSLELQIDRVPGYSLRDICLDGPEVRPLNIEITQSCLFMSNTPHYLEYCVDVLRAVYLCRHSLLEYAAACEFCVCSMRKADEKSNKAIDRGSRAG